MGGPMRAADIAQVLASGGPPPNIEGNNWPEPRPLPCILSPVQMFDPCLLPNSIRPWIEDIAERIQCPIDFPAVGAMVGLAAVVGRKVGIRPKRQDDWLVVPNLWGAIIGRPGIMKTPALSEVLKPLKRLEVEAAEDFRRAQQDFATQEFVRQAQRKESMSQIRKAIKSDGDPRAIAEELLATDEPEPTRKRFLIHDSTVEKLGVLLNENPNGFLCTRDELVGLLAALERDGQEGARAFYLEAWNGTGRFTYDRIGRGTLDIEACCVSIVGGIQPGPLLKYLRSAVYGGEGDDGLLQRFQLAVWPDPSPEWRNVDRWPDTTARDQAHRVYRQLDALDINTLNIKRDGFDVESIPFLRFNEDAQERFNAWRSRLEHQLRSGVDHPSVAAHLAKYRSLVPSLALLIHLAEDGDAAVPDRAAKRAIGWATYLESHARRLYATVTGGDVAAATKLAEKIRGRKLKDGFALRDVYRPGWAGLSSREDASTAAEVLVDHDWLRETKESTGGAPRIRYWINSKIFVLRENGTAKTDKSPPG